MTMTYLRTLSMGLRPLALRAQGKRQLVVVAKRHACTWSRAPRELGTNSSRVVARAPTMNALQTCSNSSSAAHCTAAAPNANVLLQQAAVAEAVAVAPSSLLTAARAAAPSSSSISNAALRRHFLTAAIPMVGFGFMDNFVMIQAGQYIDSTIGVQLGLATMTAAAAGQVVSDVSGVLFGGTLERLAARFQRQGVTLTAAQRQLPLAKNVALAGAVMGVILGCALGATTLLLVDLEARDRVQNARQLRDIVSDMIATAQQQQQSSDANMTQHSLPSNVVCTVHVASDRHFTLEEEDEDDMTSNQATTTTRLSFLRNASAAVRQCAQQQEVLVTSSSSSSSSTNNSRNYSTICAPIRLANGAVLGVLEMQLMRPENDDSSLLEQQHAQTAKLMGQHLGIVVKHLLE